MKATIETRRFEQPDDLLDMKECGGIAIVKMGSGTTGMHAMFEPGWTWQSGLLPMHHTGYCISGTLVVRMLGTGTHTRIAAGDFFEIPPGHDAHVEGVDRVELILFAPPEHQH